MSMQEHKEEVAHREKERAMALHDLHGQQKAYDGMQKDRESVLATLASLQQDPAAGLQAITRYQEELAYIKAPSRHHDEQLQGVRLGPNRSNMISLPWPRSTSRTCAPNGVVVKKKLVGAKVSSAGSAKAGRRRAPGCEAA
jgi:hypothetical protein